MKKVFCICGIMVMFLLCSCKKENTNPPETASTQLTEENAGLVTYEYLYNMAKGKLDEETVYLYNVTDMLGLGEYKGVTIETKAPEDVLDVDARELADDILAGYALKEYVKEGKVAEGDVINIDLEAFENDKKLEDASLKNYEYKLGGKLLDELDERLVGVEIGKTFEMPAHFSEDYENQEFAGKDIVFTIKVNFVVKYTAPEFDEEFAKQLAKDQGEEGKYTNYEEFVAWKKQVMTQAQEQEYKDACLEEVWDKVLSGGNVLQIPKKDFDAAYNQVLDAMKAEYESNVIKYESYSEFLEKYGYNEETIKTFAKESANSYVKEKMVVLLIAQNEDITVSDEELEDCVLQYANDYKYATSEEFYKVLGASKNEFIIERYYELLYYKVRDFVWNSRQV